MSTLSLSDLKEWLHYNPETGEWTWKKWRKGLPHNVTKAGYVDGRYTRLHFQGTTYRSHRLAWFYVHGVWPREIDHINGNSLDNRLCNLRETDRSGNMHNTHVHRSGRGRITYNKNSRKWVAVLQYKGTRKTIGYYKTEEEASRAYWLAKLVTILKVAA